MKKTLSVLAILFFLAAGPVYAAEAVGGPCTLPTDCNSNSCDQTRGKCVAASSGSGAEAVGGPCTLPTDCDSNSCDQAKGKCIAAPSGAGAGTGSTDTSTAFVPLTNIPFINEIGNSSSLPNFFNDLYKICIGLAAVLAVLQLIRAGIMYMGGDSVTEKSAARNLIVQTFFGLLLVLSPVIVFTIINPSILSLKINNLNSLAVPASSGGSAAAPAASSVCTATEQAMEVDGYALLSSGQSCQDKYGTNGNTGITQIHYQCCDDSATPPAGYVCCAHPIGK